MRAIPQHEFSANTNDVISTSRVVGIPVTTFGYASTSAIRQSASVVGRFEIVALRASLKRPIEFVPLAFVVLMATGGTALFPRLTSSTLPVRFPSLDAVAVVEDVLVLARENSRASS